MRINLTIEQEDIERIVRALHKRGQEGRGSLHVKSSSRVMEVDADERKARPARYFTRFSLPCTTPWDGSIGLSSGTI
jgi:hypothetical protein